MPKRTLTHTQAMLADQLNAHDLDTLTDGKIVRWRNTAQWARNAMREENLIFYDTPRGSRYRSRDNY